jgi:hypothetical protein
MLILEIAVPDLMRCKSQRVRRNPTIVDVSSATLPLPIMEGLPVIRAQSAASFKWSFQFPPSPLRRAELPNDAQCTAAESMAGMD